MPAAPKTDTRPHVTLKYVTRFQCLGSECEDTCCAGWTVNLSEKDYRAAKNAVSGCKVDRERFRESVKRNRDANANPHRDYARIQMRTDTNECHWFDGGMCGLQKRHGAEALPDVCMVYPRVLSETMRRKETAGYLSCPEIARQMLLHDDACDLVVGAPPTTDRRLLVQIQGRTDGRSAYVSHLDQVRAAFHTVLEVSGLSECQKLFALCLLASRTDGFFNHSAASDLAITQRFDAEVARLVQPSALADAARFIDSQEPKQRFSLVVVSELLTAIASFTHSPTFRALVQDVFDHYLELSGQRTPGSPTPGPDGGAPVRLDAVLEVYMQQMRRLRLATPEVLERAGLNHAKYYCFSHWYTASPNLTAHLQRLLLERALTHFLLAGHRGLHTALQQISPRGGQSPDEWDAQARVDAISPTEAALVQVMYLTARTYEHNSAWLQKVGDRIRAAGYESLAASVLLLKF